jgi:predicted Rossmann fold flavoprotein
MAAIFAARAGQGETILLEGTRDGGRKILISGGGRCNVLPARVDEARFVTASSPATLRNMLRSWPLGEQIAFFEQELGIPLAEEVESGKLFPRSNRARDVRDGLLAEAARSGARFVPDCRVTGLAPDAGRWRVDREGAPPLLVDRVIVATGGLSVPRTGSDGAGLAMLRHLGHTIHPTYAALTPLTATPPVHASLSGLSLPVTLRVGGTKAAATGGFLFTHRGYSGPAVLDVSHHAVRAAAAGRPQPILAQWTTLVDTDWHEVLQGGDALVLSRLRAALPERLAQQLLAEADLPADQRIATLRRDGRLALVERLCRYPLPWTGDDGYRKAEVTGGGVALDEIDPRTMACRRLPGLFLCGELLDAFGPIGGHNFAWAWASGRLAGLAAARHGANIAAP